MSKKPLRVAVAGCGDVAQTKHLPHWKELADEGRVELASVCDIIPGRADASRDKFGADKAFTDFSEMIDYADYDVLDVCTQNRLHAPMTIDGLKAGANVLVEKPMAMNVREAQKMIKTAETAGRKLMVAQYMRFEGHSELLKKAVDAGELGDIYTGRTYWMRRRGIPGWGKFHIAAESLGGPLIDIGVHMLDLCLWLMGSPVPVAASGKVYRKFGDRKDLVNPEWGVPYPAGEFDVEDYATAFIRFENGVTLTTDFSWAANIPDEVEGLSILGDKGGISTNPLGIYSAEYGTVTRKSFDFVPEQYGHRGAIRHFVECVEKDKQVLVRPEESLRVQKIIDAIYESSDKNKEINIK